MDASNDTATDYVVSWKLATTIGLRTILDPKTIKIRGRNAVQLLVGFGLVLPTSVTALSIVFGFDRWKSDTATVLTYAGYTAHLLFSCGKLMFVFYHSDKLWKCYGISRLNFGTYLRYDERVFRKWRRRSTRVSLFVVVTCATLSVFWCLWPRLFDDKAVRFANDEGSWDVYKMNVYNICFFVSDETYNRYFDTFYCLESTVLLGFSLGLMLFEFIIVTMCSTISCQLERISDAVRSLQSQKSCLGNGITTVYDTSILREKCDMYDELIMIIKDHQKVLKVMKDFYEIFKLPILAQIFFASYAEVMIWFVAAMAVFENNWTESTSVVKLLTVSPLFAFELYMVCYFIGIANEKKESIILALYSSDWTEMDKKSQKLVLLTMLMNNANNLKIKFTDKKIVNMMMFTATMRLCYSIFSTLVKSNK